MCARKRDGQAAIREAQSLVSASSNDDSRFALRVLRKVVTGEDVTARDALVVWPGASAFILPGSSERVTLPPGSPLRRILDHFVTRRLETPGEIVSIDEVIRAGWPDEKIGTDAALNRAYVALTKLRKTGLRDALLTTEGGYMLSEAIVVRRERQD